ncbi:tripartite tricarboxylate transporter TctB family protein [Robertmurraya andreesenii]|uniref:4-hydroxybenzoate polyprenyltransferase n=1 Tax=Anoxybacillus andreesenii TaxID=1325932 RepID=A0ABT9V8A6_9BACL|nr:tripartite tricarboxylate transporter TctB family protein [Robertmurraya andreesenii]MDQ0157183.1 4-hydroxybenzoate polyprenyltransferase [Robertmurraya andreesenii]
MKLSKHGLPILLLVISLFILIQSLNIKEQSVFDPSSGAFLPAIISLVLILCTIIIWKEEMIKSQASRQHLADPDNEIPEVNDGTFGGISKKVVYMQMALFVVLSLVFAFLMNYVNFLILSIVFLIIAMILIKREGILKVFITSIVTSAIIYYSFVYVFKIVFPV